MEKDCWEEGCDCCCCCGCEPPGMCDGGMLGQKPNEGGVWRVTARSRLLAAVGAGYGNATMVMRTERDRGGDDNLSGVNSTSTSKLLGCGS